jgi:hypothetical protein
VLTPDLVKKPTPAVVAQMDLIMIKCKFCEKDFKLKDIEKHVRQCLNERAGRG